jgi:chemotaxis protein CheD
MSRSIVVGISDLAASRNPDILVTYALGSCVGICLYDDRTGIGGLAHIMLPRSSQFSETNPNRMKYADTAIPDLIKKMQVLGADPGKLTARIAGGAKMFETQGDGPLSSIGDRNVDSVKQILSLLRIPVIVEDTRKNYGRTIYFHLNGGRMEVRSLQNERKGL